MGSFITAMIVILFYFLPTLTAARGRRGSVFVLNFFFGWTVIGWVMALFMAVRSKEVA